VKKSRADGLLFNFGWGCSYQSSAARLVCDIVKSETGIPTAILNQGATTPSSQEAMYTRIEAFIEMLKGARPSRAGINLASDPLIEIGRS
jgi:benzoyl-CoA reductase/2-hydroxyglutaryl-CoA dehydratase subunit BcrC/BadD/HgdB